MTRIVLAIVIGAIVLGCVGIVATSCNPAAQQAPYSNVEQD